MIGWWRRRREEANTDPYATHERLDMRKRVEKARAKHRQRRAEKRQSGGRS